MDTLISKILTSENINDELYYVASIDGENCKKLESFLEEIGRAFKFPNYYSKNLNSLGECLNDLEWLNKPNYFLIISNSKDLLKNESEELRNAIRSLLDRTSEEWANVPNFEGEELQRNKSDFKVKML